MSWKINKEVGLCYDDVLIVPADETEITSRLDTDVSVQLGYNHKINLKVPIISAPMDTVTGKSMLEAMDTAGSIGILHRFMSISERLGILSQLSTFKKRNLGVAVGLEDNWEDVIELAKFANVVTVDIANAHQSSVLGYVRHLKRVFTDRGIKSQIMVGNVATRKGVYNLLKVGADIVKCNIGSGASCITRQVTGVGVPSVTAIMECRKGLEDFISEMQIYNDDQKVIEFPTLIADGGIKYPGDVAKAIAAGADAVMVGSLLAPTMESLGKISQDSDGKLYKTFRGMASEASQIDRKGSLKPGTIAEGISTSVPYNGDVVEDVLNELVGGLRSAMTYTNSKNLLDLYNKSKFIQVTHAGNVEGQPHILLR